MGTPLIYVFWLQTCMAIFLPADDDVFSGDASPENRTVVGSQDEDDYGGAPLDLTCLVFSAPRHGDVSSADQGTEDENYTESLEAEDMRSTEHNLQITKVVHERKGSQRVTEAVETDSAGWLQPEMGSCVACIFPWVT
ncbi:unnamed protein product [Ranitomeya imitator]|uniref:Uncharacterized protein n=1 Tax=Ranitomeya imitator TaxID=111125 RepID=A0ABN9M8W4_9NEOB|nr:unnamed protein product [Ranitomeya imitator]